MKRRIDKWLRSWKRQKNREVLLVRGARQIGKTYSIRQLGASFDHFIEVNFEELREIHGFFEGNLTAAPLCEKLSAYFGQPIVAGKTLLFFDEIQACPNALSALRFFYEQLPDLHVVASGSLLEFALELIPSHGVGRLTSLYMYPMSFPEFLEAAGEKALLSMVEEASPDRPLDEVFHRKLVDRVRSFQLIGGMPGVIASYVRSRDLNRCMSMLDDLFITLQDDFAKYASRASIPRLGDVYNSTFHQAGGKFMYSRVKSNANTAPIRQSLELLIKAGLAIRVCHTAAQGLPLAAQAKPAKFKILPSDTGLMQRVLGLDIAQWLVSSNTDLINKGSLAETFVGLELIRCTSPKTRPSLHYWHRESRGSSAEVDYVIERKQEIIPVEVKAGSTGKMRSLHMFMKERSSERGIRISLENYARNGAIETHPLYAVWCLENEELL